MGKTDDLILDGGAVTRSLDRAAVGLRLGQVLPDDPVCIGVGIGEPAGELFFPNRCGEKGKGRRLRFTPHLLKPAEIYAPPVHPGRGAGFKTFQGNAELLQVLGQAYRGLQPSGSKIVSQRTVEDSGSQVDTACENDAAGRVESAAATVQAEQLAFFNDDLFGHILAQREHGLAFEDMVHGPLVAGPVNLRPQRLHCRPLARVEYAHLKQVAVGVAGHLSA